MSINYFNIWCPRDKLSPASKKYIFELKSKFIDLIKSNKMISPFITESPSNMIFYID